MAIPRALFLAVLVVSAAGCVTSKSMYTANGKAGFAISCSGRHNAWSDCLAEAGQKCMEQGYTVLERNGETVPVEFHNYNASSDVHAKLFAYSEQDQARETDYKGVRVQRSMVVECGHG